LFWQLQYYGCHDSRFSWEEFGNQPDWLIFQALVFYSKQKRMETNSQSFTEAVGWSGLFNGFSKEGSRKTETWEILPFPDEAKVFNRRLSEQTTEILADLISDGRLPTKVSALAQQFEEVVQLIEE
jgi:hypothetical protein